ncbi:hypothetical protein GGH96_006171 [Coemansia sp. RSA 1972]|nr:hypothetical protein GGH96_006171 [Coemansia sp. RSA 1972]
MSEKREYLEPAQPQSEYQDPSYDDGERGLFSSNHGPSSSQQQQNRPQAYQQQYPPNNVQQQYPPQNNQQQYPPQNNQQQYPPQYQQQSPPQYQEPYMQHQQQQYNSYQNNLGYNGPAPSTEPIHLTLINPQRPNSGFSSAFPERLRALARSPIDHAKWSQFIQELNSVLAKAPGSVANGFADFWVVRLATLGTATHARNMYSDRVFNNAMELVEKYNQLVFVQSGLSARLKVVSDISSSSSSCSSNDGHKNAHGRVQQRRENRRERREDRRERREERRGNYHGNESKSLELVIERV